MTPEEVSGLIGVLRDHSARPDERDDAAIDLGHSDDPAALEALLEVARDPSEDEYVLPTAGASIAEIAARTGAFDPAWLDQFVEPARGEFEGALRAWRPQLLGDRR